MKLLRLRLRNYRGVADAELRFAERGVTIVEGRNEAGKSSIAEAIGVLFDYLDDSRHGDVRALKPVHRDEGAEIEADVETGPYAFTYSKRFHKKHETRLAITKPRPENLTGRPAHERAAAMLAETIDVALWKALRIEQGVTRLEGPALGEQTRLSAALDAAAGSARAGEREESLLDAARGEFERWFTPTGLEKQELRGRHDALDAQRRTRDESGQELAKLEADVARSEQLRRDVGRLESDASQLALVVKKHDETLESLRQLEGAAATARAESSEAGVKARAAAEAVERRGALVSDVTARTKEHAALREELELAAPGRTSAEHELGEARRAEQGAREAAATASELLELRRKDREFRHDELDLVQVRERVVRVEQARKALAAAEETLEGPVVTDSVVDAIEAAQREVVEAQARLTVGSARVTVTARAPVEPRLDGKAAPLRAGETVERAVERSLKIELPGVADVEIVAGSGATGLRAALEQAQAALETRLRAAQAADPAAARRSRDARVEATRVKKEQEKQLAESLRDLSEEQLRAKVESLAKRVADYQRRRAPQPPLPADLAAAKRLETEADGAARRSGEELKKADERLERASKRANEFALADAKVGTRVQLAEQAIREAEEKLERARESVSDEALARARIDADRAAKDKADAAKAAADTLAASAPEQARALAENARRAAHDAARRLADSQREQGDLRVRLQLRGEEGLAERHAAAAAACDRLALELERTRARAAAAKLLHETLVAAKREAQSAYVAPLQAQVERLGKLVFGPTLQVELDESLAIARRTLDGVTVPFDSLSGGAREQLSLLMRLACAIVVAKEGGAPLVIDDALGYSDPERLESMGAALAQAGASCQVIVLTCLPERYRHVGGARRVGMGAMAGAGS